MILPIVVYGAPILREPTEDVLSNSEALQGLIDDMIETMRGASGIGLAAPQVGKSERLFVVDLSALAEEHEESLPGEPMVFINPEIIEEGEEEVEFEEGCLSIPDIHETVFRPDRIVLNYLDRDFNPQQIEVEGLLARVIQHEFDHLEGVLFIDHISAFRRRLLRRRLKEMASGNVSAEYPLTVATEGLKMKKA